VGYVFIATRENVSFINLTIWGIGLKNIPTSPPYPHRPAPILHPGKDLLPIRTPPTFFCDALSDVVRRDGTGFVDP
jgi:hypothetical protein